MIWLQSVTANKRFESQKTKHNLAPPPHPVLYNFITINASFIIQIRRYALFQIAALEAALMKKIREMESLLQDNAVKRRMLRLLLFRLKIILYFRS